MVWERPKFLGGLRGGDARPAQGVGVGAQKLMGK